MGESFQEMLDYRELTETYRSAPTIQGTPFTDTFFPNPSATTADEIQLYRQTRVNQPAPANTRGSNPRQLKNPSLDKIQYALFYSFNEMEVDASTLRHLQSTDSAMQAVGREALDGQIQEAGTQQRLFREVVLQQIFAGGRVNLAADGQILVPSIDDATGVITDAAGTQQSVDFGFPDSRRGDCGNIFGTDGGGFWDTADTNMFQQLRNASDEQVKQGSPPLTTIWLNALRAPALINNTQFKTYAANNSIRNEAVLNAGGVDNIWGFKFRFLQGYWTDSTGTQRPLIPLKKAIITPEGFDWYRRKQGTEMVPTQVGIFNDFMAALNSLKPVVGMFAYAQAQVTPKVKLSTYSGDNFGVGFPDQKALWVPTVFAS